MTRLTKRQPQTYCKSKPGKPTMEGGGPPVLLISFGGNHDFVLERCVGIGTDPLPATLDFYRRLCGKLLPQKIYVAISLPHNDTDSDYKPTD